MKILLIYPNVRGMNMLPTAIGLFTAILREEGHEVQLFDSTDYPNPEDNTFDSDKRKEIYLNARPYDDTILKASFIEEDALDAFEKYVTDYNPDLMIITMTEDMYPIGINLLKRTGYLNIPTLAGGVFPTNAPDMVLENPEINMVCIGEGENVIRELCRKMQEGKSYEDIQGLYIRTNNSIIKNPLGPPVDINSNPPLDLSLFCEARLYRPMEGKVWRTLPLETHRGCIYNCTYCNAPPLRNLYKEYTGINYFRKKSIEKIREEIVHFKENYHPEVFFFWADSFLSYSDHEFEEFVNMYSKFKIPFWCQARPEQITRERVKQLKEIGLFRMGIGVEHGNEEFRRQILRRNVTNETIIKNLKILNDEEVLFSVNNILGFPYETRELTFDTIELNRHIHADSINAFTFSPFHGTHLRDIAIKEGYIEPDMIARSLTRPTFLRMPQYPPDQIEGMRRCFIFYVMMPKDRWPEIAEAEKLTAEGDLKWEELHSECAELMGLVLESV